MLAALLLALVQTAPADMPQGDGPRATSGEQRYDAVGYAGIGDVGNPASVSVVSDAVPVGSFLELTALDTGHTIVALVAGRGVAAGHVVELSPGAAQQLKVGGARVAVRVRLVTPIAQDQAALQRGGAASARMDAPPSLLVALRRRIPADGVSTSLPHTAPTTPPRAAAKIAPREARPVSRPGAAYPAPATTPAVRNQPIAAPEKAAPRPHEAAAGPGWYVQVAALSSRDRAQALVSSLGGGRVVSTGNLHRVQIGPYPSTAAAQHARDGIARRGYGGAAIIRAP